MSEPGRTSMVRFAVAEKDVDERGAREATIADTA